MSIPLDRLYHYLADQASRDMLIYRWYPHGSKKLEDLLALTNYKQDGDQFGAINPIMICHDQEPLQHELYNETVTLNAIKWRFRKIPQIERFNEAMKEISQWGLRACVEFYNIYDRVLLLHSEQNSLELQKFQQQGFVPVYYWSHAIIAADWFRYAQHDPALTRLGSYQTDFLIYNRAWSGSREYRLCFAQGLVQNSLLDHCRTSFSPWCNGTHYSQHQYRNASLKVQSSDLEQYFAPNHSEPLASADYDNQDYSQCAIEVVLETVMDDSRWHLTEKTLRPIACGMPFMLLSSPGSLEYLRYYGFKTFHPLIDETYDSILDSRDRVRTMQKEMSRLAALPVKEKQELYRELDQIARINQERFFSAGFLAQVLDEYKQNLSRALETMELHRQGRHLNRIRSILSQVPNRNPEKLAHINQLCDRIMAWNRGDPTVPENW
jgi:hypothetical protein